MSIARHHNEWLALVPNSGPFVSLLVATQAFPQGLDAHDVEHARRLRQAFDEWDEDQSGKRPDTALHRAWIRFVFRETLGYDEALVEGQAIPQTLRSEIAEHGETLQPNWVLIDPETKKARLLIQIWPRSQALDKQAAASRWRASPDTRMTQLLRDTGIRLGLVTNGDQWMLVNAPPNETTGYASWYGNLWVEEPITLRAFRTLLCAERLFGVAEEETIEGLLDRSASDQQEVTDQLGYQVRKAVEVLIQALDKADQDHGRQLLVDVDEKALYEAALTVMMRLVFLFCAEERGLLLLGDDLWDRNYAVSTLREQLRVAADQHGEEILGFRHDAWARLLTTFRAVYGGVKHDRFKLPAYGGSLFNPDRFPFLEGRKKDASWKDTVAAPLPVSNRTVLHLLEALQVLQVRLPGGGPAEARKLSFRSLDIEQIGHVYEGLLDHTAKRAQEPVLGLKGTRDKEPEIPLSELEWIAAKGESELVAKLKDETGRSESALKKALHTEIDNELVSRFRTACQYADLWERTAPLAGLVREDSTGYPVVITPGSVFVTKGTDRRSTGTHYTPRSLTEPIVQYTLEPLVYVGPAEGLPKEQWKLRSAKELLDLKICDIACGSGAFLVQACRYMAARLLEAWDEVQRANPGTVRVTPEGEPSTGQPGEMLIPDDPDERQTYALRIVAQRCLYGVDKNPLAVEMAKLSLWLLTLAKDKPFEFLDHAIRSGDSLIGIHNLDQLRKFNLEGQGDDSHLFLGFLDREIHDAVGLRRQLTGMQANTVEDVELQDRTLRQANEKIDQLKCAADLLISAQFAPGSSADKRSAKDWAAMKVASLFQEGALPVFKPQAHNAIGDRRTFHWPLEFPEVMVERGGFDALVSNPPFLNGKRISTAEGKPYLGYIARHVADGQKGSADLSTFFLLRSLHLTSKHGLIGLVIAKAVTEGISLKVGLHQAVKRATIVRAERNMKWPGTAGTYVCAIQLKPGMWRGSLFLNGCQVSHISGDLEAADDEVVPHTLQANAEMCCVGSYILGAGFILTDAEAQQLLSVDPENRLVVQPYVGGDDVNSTVGVHATRWIINFYDWTEEQARRYRGCYDIVRARVLPERLKKAPEYQRYWWRYARPGSLLRNLPRRMNRCFVGTTHTKYPVVELTHTEQVFDIGTLLCLSSSLCLFAVWHSVFHEQWSYRFGSTLGDTLRYMPKKCFDTYPFPFERPDAKNQALESIGTQYQAFRRESMLAREEGLTLIYNRFHDPNETSTDVGTLRALHVEMDNAVAAAYRWTDLDLGRGFHETKQGVRFTIGDLTRREVLARLASLNLERHEAEVRQALEKKKRNRAKVGTKAAADDDSPGLFE